MPSPLRDPKSLFDWLELDYYRRPSRLRRIRYLVIWLVFLLTGALLAATLYLGKRTLYEAGPVSAAHTLFNNDCARCHTEPFQEARRLWPSQTDFHSVKDAACSECHEGPLHQEQQTSLPACASCHQEHRGRARLALVANQHCTSCHADLQRKDHKQPHFQNVESFAGNHPEFALWRKGEAKNHGGVAFNRQLHLHLKANGMVGPNGKPMDSELDCRQSCHQLDANRRYLLPINYDRHCSQCHPLSVQLDVSAQASARPAKEGCQLEVEAAKFRSQPAPHRSAKEVHAALLARLAELVQRCPDFLESASFAPAATLLPGKQREQINREELSWVKRQLRQSERMLFEGAAGCRFCHTPQPPSAERKESEPPEFLPTNIPKDRPRRWFVHSRFSHDSHRSLSCAECHAAENSQRSSDIILPRLGTCQKCHNPQGARSDCIECHSYHDRSREKSWKGKMKIDESLERSPK